MVIESPATETAVPVEVWHWQADSLPAFAALGAANDPTPALTGRGDREQVSAFNFAASLLPLLEVRPLLGRVFLPAEAHDGRNAVVIPGDEFWRRRPGVTVVQTRPQ
ncbi:MAG: hypothetical protein ACRELE_00295 [Gemmatimonadales bacterium]